MTAVRVLREENQASPLPEFRRWGREEKPPRKTSVPSPRTHTMGRRREAADASRNSLGTSSNHWAGETGMKHRESQGQSGVYGTFLLCHGIGPLSDPVRHFSRLESNNWGISSSHASSVAWTFRDHIHAGLLCPESKSLSILVIGCTLILLALGVIAGILGMGVFLVRLRLSILSA